MVSNAEIKTDVQADHFLQELLNQQIGSARPGKTVLCRYFCSDLLFGFLEFVEFRLKYVVPKSKARINPDLAFLSGVCYLFFQAIHNLHMTHCKWEDGVSSLSDL